MSHLPDDTDGLDAARALYGGPDSGEADAAAREDALFNAWADGWQDDLRYGQHGAPATRPAVPITTATRRYATSG